MNERINEKGIGHLTINNLVTNIRYSLLLQTLAGFPYTCITDTDIVNDMFNFYLNFETNVEGPEQHIWEKFCIQAHPSNQGTKRFGFLACVRLENGRKKFNFGERYQRFIFY